MKISSIGGGALPAAAAALILIAGGTGPATAVPVPTSSFGVRVTLTLARGRVDAGPTPVSSVAGSPSNLASLRVPGVLSTGVIDASATLDRGTGNLDSSASVAGLDLVAGTTLTAISVAATCAATSSGIPGGATLVDAVLAGHALAVDPAPNTVVNIGPLIAATLNEQVRSPDGRLTVTGIHLRLTLPLAHGDVIISSASCGRWAAPAPVTSGTGLSLGLGLLAVYAAGLAGLWWRRHQIMA